jgi:hypothetical protein
MWWFLLRIIAFVGWAVLLCLVMALATASFFSDVEIDNAYEREIKSIRLVSYGLDPERRLPCERRAILVANYLGDKIDSIGRSRPQSRASDGFVVGWYVAVYQWWDKSRPKIKRVLPLCYIRLETYTIITLTCVLFYAFAFYLGEHFAREKIRSGVHKRNVLPAWIRLGLNAVRNIAVACMGLVYCLPVVYWIIPMMVLSATIIVLWRANSIQGLAFLTPGKV